MSFSAVKRHHIWRLVTSLYLEALQAPCRIIYRACNIDEHFNALHSFIPFFFFVNNKMYWLGHPVFFRHARQCATYVFLRGSSFVPGFETYFKATKKCLQEHETWCFEVFVNCGGVLSCHCYYSCFLLYTVHKTWPFEHFQCRVIKKMVCLCFSVSSSIILGIGCHCGQASSQRPFRESWYLHRVGTLASHGSAM